MELRHLAVLGILIATGCADDNTGTLLIPVQQRASDGAIYHLTGTVQLAGFTGMGIEVESTADDKLLEVEVAAGNLWLAWTEVTTLDVSSDGVAWHPVDAQQPAHGNKLPEDLVAFVERHQSYTMKLKFVVHATSGDTTVIFDLP